MFTYEVLDRLRKEYEKSFYVIDKDAFLFHFHLWREALSAEYPNVEIAYSYKTNYLPFLCDAVNRAGGFAEVVSATEFSIAQRINVPIDKIILNGPYKPLHLTLETLSGGGIVNVDSFSEAEQIVDYIRTLKEKPAYIGIRCNFCVDNRSSRFGIATDSHDFIKTINLFAENGIKINSLHCHIKGRGVDTWKKKAQNMVVIYKSIKNYCSDNCIIDLGGGLPALIDEHERKIQIEAYVDAIAGTFKREFGGNGPHLFLEPGTALAAPCMSFVTSVMNKKELNGIMYAILMFISTVRKYTRAKVLTPRMLNELIDHIEVHQAEKIDGIWEQHLVIHYNCVGAIFIPDVFPLPAPQVSVNTRKGVVVNYAPGQLAV